jgi:hypothetical protein
MTMHLIHPHLQNVNSERLRTDIEINTSFFKQTHLIIKEEGIMRVKKRLTLALMLGLVLLLGVGCATTQKASEPAHAEWRFHDIVDVAFVQQYAKVPQPEGAMIIDSRPYMPKYANGHIPTAVSIPDSQFDKLTDKLPADKNTLLIFYCGGTT